MGRPQTLPFLAADETVGPLATAVPRVIWSFWTGDNPLTPNRSASLERMRRAMGVEVRLVTPKDLPELILPNAPLHPSYGNLSLVHRADYLRCWFMHYHGGGYADIKPHDHDWRPAFDRLEAAEKAIAIGYPEARPEDLGYVTDFFDPDQVKPLNKAMRRRYKTIIGNGSFIFRPGTPFTRIWLDEVHRRLDLVAPRLAANPGNVLGDNDGYPLPWTSVLGQIFHPLCLKFRQHLLIETSLRHSHGAYR